MEDQQKELQHYGVKGMRWGQRSYKSIRNVTKKKLLQHMDRIYLGGKYSQIMSSNRGMISKAGALVTTHIKKAASMALNPAAADKEIADSLNILYGKNY